MKLPESIQLIGIGFSTVAGTLSVLGFHWPAYPIFIVGIFLILYGFISQINLQLHWVHDPRVGFPIKRLIPFKNAAQIAYEKLRFATHAGKSNFGKIVEGLNSKDPLNYYFYAFTCEQFISVYGKHPPSDKFEIIPLEKFKSGILKLEENEVIYIPYDDDKPYYISLSIERGQLFRYIKERGSLKLNEQN